MDQIEEILIRAIANIIPNKAELEKLLRSEKKLNIYAGFDATAPRLTLGHTVIFRKLQAFADLGHNVIFLIGDFTTLIGDNSDKETERPVLKYEKIRENFKTYQKQAGKILDFSKIQVKFNSEWLNKLTFQDIVELCQNFSVGDFISRELIRKRLNEGKRVGLHELLYPVMQGYDHIHLDADLQIGATDQTFNMQAGRMLTRLNKKKDSFILTHDLLVGTDGRKMSKSRGNAIWLDDAPEDMYAKVMAIEDDLIIQYFTLVTNVPLDEVEDITKSLEKGDHPMSVKKKLALRIVTELHDAESAKTAAGIFEKTIQKKEAPDEILTINFSLNNNPTACDVIIANNLASSKSEVKRLSEQEGIRINGEVLKDPQKPFKDFLKNNEALIQKGKHVFRKFIVKK